MSRNPSVTRGELNRHDRARRGDLGAHAPLLEQARRQFVNGLAYAAVLTGFLNLLQLTVPLFMLQLYDRVLNSHNLDTLAMLIVVAAFSAFSSSSGPASS